VKPLGESQGKVLQNFLVHSQPWHKGLRRIMFSKYFFLLNSDSHCFFLVPLLSYPSYCCLQGYWGYFRLRKTGSWFLAKTFQKSGRQITIRNLILITRPPFHYSDSFSLVSSNVVQLSNMLSVCDSVAPLPPLEVFEIWLDQALINVVLPQSCPCFEQEIGLDTFWGPLSNSWRN